jgi:hypothetical protein
MRAQKFQKGWGRIVLPTGKHQGERAQFRALKDAGNPYLFRFRGADATDDF